ncbi:hypothetical protein MBANPS3_012257, partial [Mucor bainieri]
MTYKGKQTKTQDDLIQSLNQLSITMNNEEASASNLSNAPPRDDNIVESEDEEIMQTSIAGKRRESNKLGVSIYQNTTTSLTSLAFIGMYGADGVTLKQHNSVALCFKSITFPWCDSFLRACGVKGPILG